MDSPLAGIRVLDLTRYLSGPYATLLLAEMGAEVIKVEAPKVGDDTRHIAPLKGGVSYYHSSVNRSKASVELNLRSEADRNTIRAMLPDFDVLIENFRAGVMESAGLGPEEIAAINPRMVYCSIKGFSADGPHSNRAAFDLIIQGESGIMSMNGESDRPPSKLGLPVADLSSGMYAVHGILAALLRRERTGKGGLVEVNMMSSLFSLSAYFPALYFMRGTSPARNGSRHPGVVPYGPYATADGLVLLSTFSDNSWKRIVDALDRPDLGDDLRFSTAPARVIHRDECDALITEMLAKFTSEEAVERLGRAGIPCGIVRSLGEALDIERASGTGAIVDVEYPGETGIMPAARIPMKFDGEWCSAKPAPALGEHNSLLEQYRRSGT
jgi:crotonobetainyl-CoA:carnitine CoA-transferase CaiB-like acyl-CoA transferase